MLLMHAPKDLISVERHCTNRAVLLKRSTPAERAFRDHLTRPDIPVQEQQGIYLPFYVIADFYLPEQRLIVEIGARLGVCAILTQIQKSLGNPNLISPEGTPPC